MTLTLKASRVQTALAVPLVHSHQATIVVSPKSPIGVVSTRLSVMTVVVPLQPRA